MKLNPAFIITTSIGYTAAVNLRLFKNPNACTGDGVICPNVAARTCCFVPGRLWGSGSARDRDQVHDVAAIFTKRGDQYCGIQVSRSRAINICHVTNLEQSVGGIIWENQNPRRKRMAEMRKLAPCTASVEGHPMYSDGVKTYVISKEKMQREGLKQPAGEEEMKEFFKKHADQEIVDEQNIAIERSDVTIAMEKNGPVEDKKYKASEKDGSGKE